MKYYIKYILQKLICIVLFPLRIFPIQDNRILFLSLEGGSSYEYSCNPKYFCEYLCRERAGQYEMVWLFQKPENYRFLNERGIRTAAYFSLRGLYYALTSRTVISNGGYLTWFPFRRKQLCINTWHGSGAYKKLENDAAGANRATGKRMEHAAKHTAAFLSGCSQFSRHVIRGAFLYDGEILPIGMPRNDIFFSERKEELYKTVRKTLGLPDTCRILFYAPTFRSRKDSCETLDAKTALSELNRLTGEDWRLLYRMHIQADSASPLCGLTDHCVDVSGYPDTQELLCAADWLITDYSSIVWDFSLTDRPLLLYTPDLDDYCAQRGFYVDIHEWGFPLCRTMEELKRTIHEMTEGAYIEGPEYHRKLLGSYERGRSCAALLDYIEGELPGHCVSDSKSVK